MNGNSATILWLLLSGFVIILMQAGFAMVIAGLCRAKNAAHTMAMAFMALPISALAFWIFGFAIGWGNWSNGAVPPGWANSLGLDPAALNSGFAGVIGAKGFFLSGDDSLLAFFFLMLGFVATAVVIPVGTIAERVSWKCFLLYAVWAVLPVSLFADWVWGGGWLAQAGKNWKLGHGAVDFAGAGVIHGMAGIIGLAMLTCVGARVGKYQGKRPMPLPGHHVPMVLVGTVILLFGWLAMNTSMAFAGTDLRPASIAMNTILAGAAGAFAAMGTLMFKRIKPDPTMCSSGMLGGLAAISGSCAFVDTWAAVIIGFIAGVLVVYSVFFWENKGVDDPVGTISVHGVGGLWGILALGIFANGKCGAGWNGVAGPIKGLFTGDSSQFVAQFLEAAVMVAFAFSMAYIWFKVSALVTPTRVRRDVEMQGLDIPEMGAKAYPDFGNS